MRIHTLHLLEGAAAAKGLTVVIDVFRAFSLACYAMDAGVADILPVAKVEQACGHKVRDPEVVLVGERDCIKLPGFDYGNSPTEILDAGQAGKLAGRTMVHTTSAGTKGLVAATCSPDATEVLTGGFVNAGAIAAYIQARQPDDVSLVAMGYAGRERSDEDELCANYIENVLLETPTRFPAIKAHLATIQSAKKFFDPAADYAPETDFDLCLDLDRFGFVLQAKPVTDDPKGGLRLVRIDP